MARIYIARSTGIGSFERHVVLKMIQPERAQDEISVQMFLDEARLAASLNHHNVAQVFEVGKEAGFHFLAMEYVHGQDLRALLSRAGSAGVRVPLELALTVVAGAAAGLEHAHERRTADGTPMGIVHRDVSPSNIMIGYDGAVKLLDFGIAKATSRSVETQSGVIKGKFAYMAPEQCRGREVDRRSDVFSLGIILYEVTTQHRCFRADNDFDTMHRIVTGDVIRPTRLIQGYPPALEAIVLKALAVDPVQRYQTAGQLLEAIEGFAAAARLSLSATALGRFMRDMFGDLPEPWLVTGPFRPVVEAREQTISNTNASGERPGPPPGLPLPPQRPSSPGAPRPPPSASSPALPRPAPASLASPRPSSPLPLPLPSPLSSPPPSPPPSPPLSPLLPSSLPSSLPQAVPPSVLPPQHEQAPLHLPPELPFATAEIAAAGPIAADWSAQGHPAMAPSHRPPVTPPPELRLPLVAPPRTELRPAALGTPHQFAEPSRSEPGPVYSPPAYGVPVYGAPPPGGPPGTEPIVRTRQGYANGPAMSPSELSPRFDAHELDGNVSLQPSNRLLYLGLGIVLVGIIVLLAISVAEGPDEIPASPGGPAASAAPGGAAADPASRAVASRAGAPALTPPAVKPDAFPDPARKRGPDAAQGSRRASIRLHVVSTPPGAEVSLSGKPIGITPLDTDTERRSGTEILTIHRARYRDVTAAVDLARDYEQAVTLAPIPEPGAARPPARERPSGRDTRQRAAPASSKDDCQPPDKINPYENACHGHVCRPCPVP